MAYNSAYTGQEIDAAIGAVKNKESTWDGKQDKLDGLKGQIVGFDEAGDAVAQDAPESGMTQEEADERYLQLTGGTLNGDLNVGSYNNSKAIYFDGPDGYYVTPAPEFSSSRVSLYCDNTAPTAPPGQFFVKVPYFVIDGDRPILIKAKSIDMNQKKIFNLADPTDDYQVTNKRYVDSKAPKSTTVTLTASGWSNNSQTVTVNGVLADETKQEIHPMPATATDGNQAAYYNAGIMCTGQGTDSLTFTCSETPEQDISVYITVQEVVSA